MAILATFLRPAFPASRVQQVSDLHLKFALLSQFLIMAALRSRCGHYILPCGFFFLLSSFFLSSPNLSRRTLDVCRTSTRGVALVRI